MDLLKLIQYSHGNFDFAKMRAAYVYHKFYNA